MSTSEYFLFISVFLLIIHGMCSLRTKKQYRHDASSVFFSFISTIRLDGWMSVSSVLYHSTSGLRLLKNFKSTLKILQVISWQTTACNHLLYSIAYDAERCQCNVIRSSEPHLTMTKSTHWLTRSGCDEEHNSGNNHTNHTHTHPQTGLVFYYHESKDDVTCLALPAV